MKKNILIGVLVVVLLIVGVLVGKNFDSFIKSDVSIKEGINTISNESDIVKNAESVTDISDINKKLENFKKDDGLDTSNGQISKEDATISPGVVIESREDMITAIKKSKEKIQEINNEKANIVEIEAGIAPEVERFAKIAGPMEFIAYDCESFSSNNTKKLCYSKKLEATFMLRNHSDYSELSCNEMFDADDFTGLENEVNTYLDKCNSEKKQNDEVMANIKKLQEENMKREGELDAKLESFEISDCKTSIEGNYEDMPDDIPEDEVLRINEQKTEEILNCEFGFAINIENGCSQFEDENKRQTCEQIKQDIADYNRMQENVQKFEGFDIRSYIR